MTSSDDRREQEYTELIEATVKMALVTMSGDNLSDSELENLCDQIMADWKTSQDLVNPQDDTEPAADHPKPK